MQHQLLIYQESAISYYRYGQGPTQVICFHGYGESGRSFAFLEETLGSSHTFHAIDLPYHGETAWNQSLKFTIQDLLHIQGLIPGDPLSGNKKVLLLGFSLGGRMALSLFEQKPASIQKMVLLAPDGLVINPWYWLATQTLPGNLLFRFTMNHPGWFFGLLKILHRLGSVNPSIFKFVNASVGNPALRLSLYQRWTVLRKLRPSLPRIKLLIRQYQTPVNLLYGRHDRIILAARGEKFRTGIEDLCSLKILPAGHQVLQPRYADPISDALTLQAPET